MAKRFMVGRVFYFDASHQVLGSDGSPCEELHGHTYRVEVVVSSPTLKNGMVLDFHDLKSLVEPILSELDHRHLNEIIPNPTAENIAVWIFDRLGPDLPPGVSLDSVRVWEGDRKWAEVRG